MMLLVHDLLIQTLLYSSALLSGIYLVFSNTIMPVLSRLDAAQGITCMQAINRRIQNPLFFAIFFGSPLVSISILVMESLFSDHLYGATSFSAALLAMAAFLTTLLVNVPLNGRLDQANPHSQSDQQTWYRFVSDWTRWNTLRAIALAFSALLVA